MITAAKCFATSIEKRKNLPEPLFKAAKLVSAVSAKAMINWFARIRQAQSTHRSELVSDVLVSALAFLGAFDAMLLSADTTLVFMNTGLLTKCRKEQEMTA